MYERIKEEPALLTGLVQAVLALSVSFGLDLTPEQMGSMLAVAAAALAIVLRGRVAPVPSVSGTPGPQPAAEG